MDLKNIADIYHLSPSQESELTKHRRGVQARGGQLLYELRGRFDLARLSEAWARTLEQRPALRTFFAWEKLDKPLQLIPKQLDSTPEFHDWSAPADSSGAEASSGEERLEEFLAVEASRGFDPSHPPLVRLSACRLAEDSHVLLLTYHPLLLDEASALLVVKDLFDLYEGEAVASRPAFKSHVEWLKRQDASGAEEFGRSALAGFELPARYVAGREQAAAAADGRRAFERLTLTNDAGEALRASARRHGLQTSDVLAAAWAGLLHGYTGADSLLFGVRASGRPAELNGADSIVGAFANTLPLPVRLAPGATHAALLELVGEERRRRAPFEFAPATEASAADSPLFESVVILSEGARETRRVGTELEVREARSYTPEDAPLVLRLVASGEGDALELNYDASRFDTREAARLLVHLRGVIEAFAAEPNRPLNSRAVLTDEELRRVLVEWNDTRTDYPRSQSVAALFEAQAAETPDAVAVVGENEELTYKELNERANQLAHHLLALGVGPETLAGVCMERSVELIVAILGVLKAGGAYVPLDPAYPVERLAFMLEDTQAPVLLTQSHLADELPSHWGQVICVDDDWDSIAANDTANPRGGASPDNLVYVIYTSGSTGRPKGVGVTHKSVVRLVKETDYAEFRREDVILQLAPVSFDASTFEIWGALLNGARLAVMPARTPSLDEIGAAVKRHKVTTMWLTAGLFHLMVDERLEDLAGVRQLLAGGDVLSVPHVERTLRALDGGRVINGYGPTESTTFACCHPMSAGEEIGRSVPIGRPIANTQVFIVNRQMQPVPAGVAGELLIGGDGLARCYHNRPELTAEKFIPDPFSTEPGARLYRTGDLARWLEDGRVEFLGRVDNQVKVRGFRIELGEIETRLSEHKAVRETVVVARADGGGEKRLVAYVAAEPDAAPNAGELRAYLEGKLPEYMVPSVFVTLDALPLNANGKVDRAALPAPSEALAELLETTFVAPSTAEEQTLADIWAQVLGVERVGVQDNFFELGGDSIRSIQIRAQAQTAGLDFSIQQLFQHQTVAELARVAVPTNAAHSAGKDVEPFALVSESDRLLLPRGVEDAYPLSMLQAGMLFHSDFNPESAIYHDMFSFHLRVPRELGLLEESIRRLLARHAVLRTSFDLKSYGEPLQLVHAAVEPLFEVEDLSHLSEQEQDETLAARFEEEKARSFDWTKAPLLRFKVCLRGEASMQFDISFHHAILDGWSVASLLTELFQTYLALLKDAGTPADAAPAASYRDFVALERQALKSEDARRFWHELLRDAPYTKFPRLVAAGGGRGVVRQLPVEIPSHVSEGVRALAQAEGVPVKSVLLAAHLRVMSLISGQPDVLTGVVANGRPEAQDGERALGLFLNNLPFRLRLRGGTWRELVKQTFAAERELLPHRRYPMVELQRALGGQKLFETCFNFTHFHVYQNVLDLEGVVPVKVKFFEESNFPCTTQFSLDLSAQHVLLRLDYMSGEIADEQARAIAGYYVNTLVAMTTEPGTRYEQTAPLSEAERRELLVEWNDTRTDYPRHASIQSLFEEQAASTPDAVAIVGEGIEITYKELNERANRLAHYLRGLGVGREVTVGLCLERSAELIVGLLGVLKAGGVYAPLDVSYPLERLAFMLEDTQAPVLLTQSHLVDRLPSHWGQVVSLDEDWELIADESGENPQDLTGSEDLAYVMYTSGTTGRPKGVAVPHRGVVRLVRESDFVTLTRDEVILQFAPVSFDASTLEIWGALLNGARLVLMPPDAQSLDEIGAAVERHEVTTMWLTAGLFHLMVDEQLSALRPLRQLLAGGDVLSVPHVERVLSELPSTLLVNGYGPTENTTFTCCHGMRGALDHEGPVPIGRPVSNTTVYLLDAQMQPVPVGAPGELYTGGDGLARGYLNRPELTAEKFVPNPFDAEGGARLYRTGDLARFLPDGRIEFLGRVDNQVKVRGFRIELGEIEAALGAHPSVRECVVTARADDGGEKRLVAYVVSDLEESQAATRLRAFLQERLPEYMLPAVFVQLEELPLNANGKVDRAALPAPELARLTGAASYVAPRTTTEEMLCGLWSDVLGVERVGVEDDFFELGGDSIRSIQMMSRVRAAFAVELPLRALFDAPTVSALAAAVSAAREEANGSSRPPLVARAADEPRRLSYAQQRLWFLDQLEPGGSAYNVPVALRLRGQLKVDALADALTEVSRRHEALRTTFAVVEGEPVQVVAPAADVPLPLTDLSGLPEHEREAEARRLALEEAGLGFDLSAGPVWRARLLRLSDEEHVLLLTMHHIVSDAWSLGVLVREVGSLYRAGIEGVEAGLPEPSVQYGDYAEWQRGWLEGGALEEQLGYWRGQLGGGDELLALPTDRPRPPVQTYRGGRVPFAVSLEASAALRELSRREGATLFMTLLAGWQALLSRYTGQREVSVGSPVAGRTTAEVEGLIGFFVNTLVLRARVEGGSTFAELVRRVREVCLGAYEHQDVPFERLVEELKPERSMSHAPLFQVMFSLQNAPAEALELPGLEPSLLSVENETTKFDLTLSMAEDGEALGGSLEYNTDLFDRTTAERMVGHFLNLLEAAAASPEQRLERLPLLNEAERRQLLEGFNDTRRDYADCGLLLHELFERQVERTPDSVALVFENERLTYAELNARSNRLANLLRSEGVTADSLVGVMLERSSEMVVSLLAVLKAGAAYVPLDPDYPAERVSYMLSDSRPAVLLTQARLAAGFSYESGRVILLDDCSDRLVGQSAGNLLRSARPSNLAYMIYTSGSTGRPKGAMNTHSAIVNRLLWMQEEYRLDSSDAVMQKTPFSFDVSVWEFFWPLLTGARLVVAQPGGHQDPSYLAGLIRREQVTTMHFVPSMLQAFLSEPDLSGCDSLRRVVCSGEALPYELQQRFFARLGSELHNLYGPTEAAVDVTYWACERDGARNIVPIGRPIANTQIYVLDARLEPVPVGVAGELYIAGVGLARGYHERPALTAEKFVADPYSLDAGARMYRTGDLARWAADGAIEYLGRIDNQVKIRGNRIELGEIEAALSEHEGVREAVVVALGEGAEKRLVAYVVAEEGGGADAKSLRAVLRARLPEYMVPSAFVELERMPVTPNGKLDRKALPAPGSAQVAGACEYVAPRTATEEVLCGLWSDVLGVERVGVIDNFFELGGHSLLGTQMMSRVRAAFAVELPLRALFDAPTVAALASAVTLAREVAGATTRPALVARPSNEPRRLSYAQQRLWFLDQLEPGGSAYNVPVALRLRGQLKVDALADALTEVSRRHEALRTTFAVVEGEPVQVVAPPARVPLPVEDLSGLPVDVWDEEARRLASEEAGLGFDLSAGPVWRARLLRLSDEEHVLLLTMHHIVSDAWSLGVLVREVGSLYRANLGEAGGAAETLSELPVQYGDYAEWQRGWLEGGALEEQLDYWRHQLGGAQEVLPLPTDRPRPPVQSHRGAVVSFGLGREASAALRELSRREGATLFMTLLAGWQTLLARYTGQREVSVGTPVAGRNVAEVEGLIGFFVNTLVLRARVEEGSTFAELVRRVREVCLGAYEHQDVPFERLVEELKPERSMSHAPLFQVMFSLQNAPAEALTLPGLTLGELPPEGEGLSEKFDLTLSMHEAGEEMGGVLSYNTDLFERSTAERMVGHFLNLIEAAAADPEQLLERLPLLDESERRQLLEGFNDTRHEYADSGSLLHELFERQVERTPDSTALVFEGERLTYAELNERSNRLANLLRSEGVTADSLVGVMLERSSEMVVSLLAVLKAGGAYVPLDPSYPADRVRFMLSDSRPAVLLTHGKLSSLLPERSADAPRVILLDDCSDALSSQSAGNLSRLSHPSGLAYMIYTSGSTGRPKGAMNTHSAIVNRLLWMQEEYGLNETDAVMQKTPFSFDVSVWEFFWPLLTGARLVVAKPGGHQDPSYIAELIEREGVTTMHFVPSMLQAFLSEQDLSGCDSLRRVICSGEALPHELQQRFFSRLGSELHNLYGPTEAAVDVTYWECERDSLRNTVPIGRPISNTQIYILDARLEPVPVGVAGELYIAGVGLARGYHGRPELTAEKFVADPHSLDAGARMYRTGDLARFLPDGVVEYLGRIDNQVKVRGNRIELGEIEAALSEHEGVREAVVVALGEGAEKRLVAYVVAEEGGGADAKSLRAVLRARLPEYMVPSAFVELERMPVTPNGKLDRKALPAPGSGPAADAAEFVAPRTPTEERVAELWATALGVEAVSVRADFFALGGHSLVAALLISSLREAFGVDIPLTIFFGVEPTVERTAEAIELLLIEQAGEEEMADALAELGGLSDEEVRELLSSAGD